MDKRLRNAYMHSNGTTVLETIGIITPSFFYTILTTCLVSLLLSNLNRKGQFVVEFVFLVLPLVLNLTILSNYTCEILISTFLVSISIHYFIHCSRPIQSKPKRIETTKNYITNGRSTINILSVIAILAVDFRVFPRRFAKTENFGYSLMDVGVGLYIFSGGIVHSTQTLRKSLKSVIPLLILGLARILFTSQFDYNVPESEYGVHWNFFITLAVTKVFTSLILNVVNPEFIYINALLLLLSHEVLLESGLKNFVLRDLKRNNLIIANREGLVSSLGYVSLYLFSVYFGHLMEIKNKNAPKGKIAVRFFLLSVISFASSQLLQNYFGISRKLANGAYCFWVLFIGAFMMGLFYCGEVIQGYIFKEKLQNYVLSPFIFDAINFNGLLFFLFSNLLTGLINILCDTLKINSGISLLIIATYMSINCFIVCILYFKKIKLKL